MTVRDLIATLLDYDMDSSVEIRIDAENFNIADVEIPYSNADRVDIVTDNGDMIAVNMSEYYELENRVDELESELSEAYDRLDEFCE